jgi:hypothetical protein
MSDASQGPGWWQASDGKWYPPADTEQPGPGWWLASDGNWYPPERRTPVKPVAKPATSAKGAVAPRPVAPPSVPATAAMGTPPGPAVAPTTPAGAARSEAADTKPAASFGAPVKPVAAAPKGPDAAPAVPPAGPKATASSDPRPTLSGGLSPDLQIKVRNEQSRRDAAVLFDARKSAASRALGNISSLIEHEKATPEREQRETGAARAATAASPDPEVPAPGRSSTPTAPKSKGKMGRVIKAARPGSEDAVAGPAESLDRGAAEVADRPPVVVPDEPTPSDPPLLEVKQGTLAADIEHIGERLVIFNDRVELHDRSDRVRQVIAGGDIADVVVHKKFTGSTVTVESGTGESIVAKGLKPEQADEIRSVILKRTRAGVPSGTAPIAAGPARSERTRVESCEPIVDARDPRPVTPAEAAGLVAKLEDLHRAGVLTDAELAEKKALVERLAQGETLVVSTPSA